MVEKFTLVTDHKPLTAILGSKKGVPSLAAARLQRWPLLLSAYSYEIQFKPTQAHGNADGLSRLPLTVTQPTDLIPDTASMFNIGQVQSLPITFQQIQDEMTCDPVLKKVRTYVAKGWPTEVAEELIKLFSLVGIPKEILTDQGSNFTSQLLTEIYRLLHVHPIQTTPYHPQTDGLVERFNKTLKSLLQKGTADVGKDWDKLLAILLFAYREVPQASMGFSPFELLYGKAVWGPLDVLRETWEADRRSNDSVVSHVLAMREKIASMTDLVRDNLTEAQRKQKRWYDQTAREREFEPEDQVLVLFQTSTSKLLAVWQGPYRVLRHVNNLPH